MTELIAVLSVYYVCSTAAADGLLNNRERHACKRTYDQAKHMFLSEDELRAAGGSVTPELNKTAYLRFKTWELENADLVRSLKQARPGERL